jgi:hypothetical protein
MHRLEAESLENQQVERALDDVGSGPLHGRRVTPFLLTVKM